MQQKKNSKDYLDILDDNLRLSMDFYFPNEEGIFQDDNARIHRARNVLYWFEMNSEMNRRMEAIIRANGGPIDY